MSPLATPASVSSSSSKQTIFTWPALLALSNGVENGRAVVAAKANQGSNVGIFHERVFGVFLRAHVVRVVGAHINDLDVSNRRAPF